MLPATPPARTHAVLTAFFAAVVAGCGATAHRHTANAEHPVHPARAALAAAEQPRQHDCPMPREFEPIECPDGQNHAETCTYRVTGHVVLDPACRYRGRLRIEDDGVSLDCAGATLDGSRVVEDASVGVEIFSPRNGAPELGVTVRDCHIQGFDKGIRLRNTGRPAQKGAKHKYALSPQPVLIHRVHIRDTSNTGIHIYPYVQNVQVINAHVEHCSDPGIYLSPRSRRTRVIGSLIEHNGFRGRNRAKSPREGLSVDGSSDNELLDNRFHQNAAGGIYLYRNCGEHASKPRPPAKNNLIRGNTFSGGPIGVWVASRQSDRSSARFGCEARHSPYTRREGDRYIWIARRPAPDCTCGDTAGLPPDEIRGICSRASLRHCDAGEDARPYFEDNVLGTRILENIFLPLADNPLKTGKTATRDAGVIVEDDRTTVSQNIFVGFDAPGVLAIRVGTPIRFYNLGRPVMQTTVQDNGYLDMPAGVLQRRIVYRYGSQPPRVNPPPTGTQAACRLDGKLIPPGASTTFFAEPKAEACKAEQRTCHDGVLSGSYAHASCEEPPVVPLQESAPAPQ